MVKQFPLYTDVLYDLFSRHLFWHHHCPHQKKKKSFLVYLDHVEKGLGPEAENRPWLYRAKYQTTACSSERQ